MEEDVHMEDEAGPLTTPVSTPVSPIPMVHQSPAPSCSTPKPSFMHCWTGLLTTLVSTPVSPTSMVHQSPTPPSCPTPEPSELSTVTINITSASPVLMTLIGSMATISHSSIPHQELSPMPSSPSQTVESTKSLEIVSECQGDLMKRLGVITA